jgi:hypothetical protein
MPAKKHSISGRTREDFEAELIVRSWKDPIFREDLLRNPRRVFEQCLGLKLPSDLQIYMLQESERQLYLVIPQNPDQMPDLELSDAQLEMVAGGAGTPVFLLPFLGVGKS